MATFGMHLRSLRQTQGMSQRALADAAGVDLSYVSKLENDRLPHTPSARTLTAFAEALRTDELELLRIAGKLPTALEPLVEETEALEVMQLVRRRAPGPGGWRVLKEYVESEAFESSLAQLERSAKENKE